jgi:hypothetical protein
MIEDILLSAGKSRTGRIRIAALAFLVLAGLATEAGAQVFGPESTLHYMPTGDLYKLYIANPHRVTFSFQYIQMIHSGIPDTGSSRYALQAGGHFGIARVYPDDHPELGWQLSIEGGIDALFDRGSSDDNIGWNGKFGLFLTHAAEHGLSYKLDVNHTSSHLGDEYIQNTGRKRIDYTREEIALGLSKEFLSHYRVYGETGWGFQPGNAEGEKPGRFEAGFELEYPNVFWDNVLGLYAAVDLQSWQERDWKPDASFQTGLYLPVRERTYRVGIQLYRGRSTMGEFFLSTESQIALGIWIDI